MVSDSVLFGLIAKVPDNVGLLQNLGFAWDGAKTAFTKTVVVTVELVVHPGDAAKPVGQLMRHNHVMVAFATAGKSDTA